MLGQSLLFHAKSGSSGGVPVRNGLVAEYKFDEGAGQVLTDYSGSGNHGQLGSTDGADTNDPTWTGEGAYFATDDYITTPVQLTTACTSIACVRDSYNNQQVLFSVGSSGVNGVALEMIGLRWYVGHRGAARSDALGVDYTGYNVFVITHNGDTSTLWNAVNRAVNVSLTSPVLTGIDTTIGSACGTSTPMYGDFLYFAHYNRVLTDAEISKNYAYLKSYMKKNRGVALP